MKNNNKTIGILFITSAIALLIPYIRLTIIFEYPNILRQDTATILTKFYQGGHALIWTWFAFAVTGLPLIAAYSMLGKNFENKALLMRMATTIGIIGLVVQVIGLLRWTFVVPVLADTFVHATDGATKAATIVAFKALHQFGGVVLGEHLGQVFTITWTIMITLSFARLKAMPKWVNGWGIVSAVVYLLAQAELFATVMKDFPVWDMAGFIGSTLWLLWMVIVGVIFIKKSA